MSKDPGHILIQYNSYNIETTLFFAIFAFALVIVLVYILLNISSFIINLSSLITDIIAPYSKHKSATDKLNGIYNSIANNWENAEYQFSKSAKRSSDISTLFCAAYAASKDNVEKAEPYMEKAYISHNKDKMLITLFHARLYINAGDYKEAVKKIYNLSPKERDHSTALYLLTCCYENLEMWEELAETLKKCYRQRALSKKRMKDLENKYAIYKLESSDPEKAYKTWKTLAKHSRETPKVIIKYVGKLLKNKDEKNASHILEKNIFNSFDKDLIKIYQNINTNNNHKTLKQLLKWLDHKPQNKNLQAAVARTYLRLGDKLKALVYMEKATENTADIRALLDLVDIYHDLDREQSIKEIYKRIVAINDKDE
jgi:heme biosynthesis-associated TPR repeat protein